jgi:hypothetical protein
LIKNTNALCFMGPSHSLGVGLTACFRDIVDTGIDRWLCGPCPNDFVWTDEVPNADLDLRDMIYCDIVIYIHLHFQNIAGWSNISGGLDC